MKYIPTIGTLPFWMAAISLPSVYQLRRKQSFSKRACQKDGDFPFVIFAHELHLFCSNNFKSELVCGKNSQKHLVHAFTGSVRTLCFSTIFPILDKNCSRCFSVFRQFLTGLCCLTQHKIGSPQKGVGPCAAIIQEVHKSTMLLQKRSHCLDYT